MFDSIISFQREYVTLTLSFQMKKHATYASQFKMEQNKSKQAIFQKISIKQYILTPFILGPKAKISDNFFPHYATQV